MTQRDQSDTDNELLIAITISAERLASLLATECDASDYEIREVIDKLAELGLLVLAGES